MGAAEGNHKNKMVVTYCMHIGHNMNVNGPASSLCIWSLFEHVLSELNLKTRRLCEGAKLSGAILRFWKANNYSADLAQRLAEALRRLRSQRVKGLGKWTKIRKTIWLEQKSEKFLVFLHLGAFGLLA